mgnify:CR=1 FL=1
MLRTSQDFSFQNTLRIAPSKRLIEEIPVGGEQPQMIKRTFTRHESSAARISHFHSEKCKIRLSLLQSDIHGILYRLPPLYR